MGRVCEKQKFGRGETGDRSIPSGPARPTLTNVLYMHGRVYVRLVHAYVWLASLTNSWKECIYYTYLQVVGRGNLDLEMHAKR